MKMQLSTPAPKMNALQVTIKKAFGQSVHFLTRNIRKAIASQPNEITDMPFVNVTVSESPVNFPNPDNHKTPNPQLELLSFEEELNGIEADLYTPFVMHTEGYRNCEIADYLNISESQVAMTISKVRDFLKSSKDMLLN